jgi:hypothetical protein
MHETDTAKVPRNMRRGTRLYVAAWLASTFLFYGLSFLIPTLAIGSRDTAAVYRLSVCYVVGLFFGALSVGVLHRGMRLNACGARGLLLRITGRDADIVQVSISRPLITLVWAFLVAFFAIGGGIVLIDLIDLTSM